MQQNQEVDDTSHSTYWDSLSPAEKKQKVAAQNNQVFKQHAIWISLPVILFSLISLIFGLPIFGRVSFVEHIVASFAILIMTGVGLPYFLIFFMYEKCPRCGVAEYNTKGIEVFKEIETKVVQEFEFWVRGTRQDAIRDASGRVTGYIDHPEKQKRIRRTVDHVYHCQFCKSTWNIRQHYDYEG